MNVIPVFQLGSNRINYNAYLTRKNNVVEKWIYFYESCKVETGDELKYLHADVFAAFLSYSSWFYPSSLSF